MRKNELHLENLLSASIINALDRHNVSYSVSEQDGRYIAELEFYSDKGSNQIVNIWFDYDEEDSQYADSTACRSFAKGLKGYYESWDVDAIRRVIDIFGEEAARGVKRFCVFYPIDSLLKDE